MASVDLQIEKLRQIVSEIEFVGLEEFDVNGILQHVIQIFDQIRKNPINKTAVDGTLELINIINNIAEITPTVRAELVSNCTGSLLELVTREDVTFRFQVEILKLTNVLLENCPNKAKEDLLVQPYFEKHLIKFGRQIDAVGDYEYQVGLIECLFRIIPRKLRPKYGKLFFSKIELLEQFLDIKDQDFETDCRVFLNNYNNDADKKQRVKSVPCVTASLGDRELRKPNDPGYDEFWADFNFGSNRLTIFCEECNATIQNSFEEESWETLSVWRTDVEQYKVIANGGLCYLDVQLINPIPMIYPSQTDVSGRVVTFTFDNTWDIEEAALQTFGEDRMSKQPSKPKVSLPATSVCVRARNSPDYELESDNEILEEIASKFDRTVQQRFPVPAGTARVKVSVPCVPIVLSESSQNSVIEPVQAIAMKYAKSRQERMDDLALEPEEGMCAEQDIEVATQSDELSSPSISKVSEPISSVKVGSGRIVKPINKEAPGIPTPKTPIARAPPKAKVKTPVVVLEERKVKPKNSRKKKMCRTETREHPEVSGKNSKKSETRRKEESMSISGSCSEGLDNVSAHEQQRSQRKCSKRQKTSNKEPTFDDVEKATETLKRTPCAETSRLDKISKADTQRNKNQDRGHKKVTQLNNTSQVVTENTRDFSAVDKDCVEFSSQMNSQDSLINEDTCNEIQSMEQDGLSVAEKSDTSITQSIENVDRRQSVDNVKVSKRSNKKEAETDEEKHQEAATKNSSSNVMGKPEAGSRGKKKMGSKKQRKRDKNIVEREPDVVHDDDDVDVIQSTFDAENQDVKSMNKPSTGCVKSPSNNIEHDTEHSNETLSYNASSKKGSRNSKRKDRKHHDKNKDQIITADIMIEDSAPHCDNGEDVIQKLNASVTFTKSRRKMRSNKEDQTSVGSNTAEQTVTGLQPADENVLSDGQMDVIETGTFFRADNSESEESVNAKSCLNKQGNITEEQKMDTARTRLTKSTKQKPDLMTEVDVYSFNEENDKTEKDPSSSRSKSVSMSKKSNSKKKENNNGKSKNVKTNSILECNLDNQSENEDTIQKENKIHGKDSIKATSYNDEILTENDSMEESHTGVHTANACENTGIHTAHRKETRKAKRQRKGKTVDKTNVESNGGIEKDSIQNQTHASALEQSSRITRSKLRSEPVPTSFVEESDVDDIEVMPNYFDVENDERVSENQQTCKSMDKHVFKKPTALPRKRKGKNDSREIIISTPLENSQEGLNNFNGGNEEILSSIECFDGDGHNYGISTQQQDESNKKPDSKHRDKSINEHSAEHTNDNRTFSLDEQNSEETTPEGKSAADACTKGTSRIGKEKELFEDEERNDQQSEISRLFNTNLSPGVKAISQRKFFRERTGSSTFQRCAIRSAVISDKKVQGQKSCEVEFGSSKNRVYLAMSYSATDRLEMPSETGDSSADPYDFEKECENYSTKADICLKGKQKAGTSAKEGTHATKRRLQSISRKDICKSSNRNSCAGKEKRKRSCDENGVKMYHEFSCKEKVDNFAKKNGAGRRKKKLSRHLKEQKCGMDYEDHDTAESERDSISLQSSQSPGRTNDASISLAKKTKPVNNSVETLRSKSRLQQKETTDLNINRLLSNFLARKRNTDEVEEYDHHDDICLSRGNLTSPVKIPSYEIALDEIVGVPIVQGGDIQLPCFNRHSSDTYPHKKARREYCKSADTDVRKKGHKSNHSNISESRSNSKAKTVSSANKSRLTRKNSTSPDTYEDVSCRSDDGNSAVELPSENDIITRFNQLCKKIVEEDGGQQVTNTSCRQDTRTSHVKERKIDKNQVCGEDNEQDLSVTFDPRTPKSPFYDPLDQVEICSIKTPMTLPCSDLESSQEGSFHSDDLLIEFLQCNSKSESTRKRDKKVLQKAKNDNVSGMISAYSTEVRPSRSSLKRKYDDDLIDEDVDETYLDMGNEQQSVCDMFHLRPRRLFNSGMKAVVEITASSDEEREPIYGRYDNVSNSQINYHDTISTKLNSTAHLDSVGMDAGVTTIVKAFGLDFQKQIKSRQHSLDVLAKTTLKSSQRHLKNMFTDMTERRANILEKFENKLLKELMALGKDVKTLEETEAKTLDFFNQQMKTLNNHRESQETRLERLKNMQIEFMASMCHMDQYESNQQTLFKTAMKKDLTSMQKKLLHDTQRHELNTVRRSLQTMIG